MKSAIRIGVCATAVCACAGLQTAWGQCDWLPGEGPPGMNGTVSALTVFNGELIAGGRFTAAGGVACDRIARWNGSTWQPLGSGMNQNVYALTVFNGDLVAGGWFTTAGGRLSAYWARWGPLLRGDFDCSGEVGLGDYWYIHAGLGYCSPHQNYLDHNKADMDSDGCITFVDYQMWLECYRQANGRDFVPPKKKTSIPILLPDFGGEAVEEAAGEVGPCDM